MLCAQMWRRATSLRGWPAARLALSRTMTTNPSSVEVSTGTPSTFTPLPMASTEVADPAPVPTPGVDDASESSASPSRPRPWKASWKPCPALQSIQKTRPDYREIFIPSRLLMDALMVPLNSRGSAIMNRGDGRDIADSVEREQTDYRNARATLSQRLLKAGDRLLTLGEVEGAIGIKNDFVWKTIWALLKKHKSPGIESLTEEEISRELFNRLPSLGMNKAHALAHRCAFQGYRTLDDLMFEPQIKFKVKNYIRLLDVQDRPIPRTEVEEFRERLAEALRRADTKYNFELVGAYRRGAAYPQSINVLVWHEGFERPGDDSGIRGLYHCLEQAGIVRFEHMLMSGPNSPPAHMQIQCLSSLGEDRPLRFLNIRLVPTECVPYRIFWDTGAGWLLGHMRLEAQKRGLELWPGGMQPLGQERPPKTAILIDGERELFELLDVPWIEPTQRGTKAAHAMLPKLRAWSSASRPSPDYLHRVLAQATVVRPGRVHPTNVPDIVAASRLPLPKDRTRDVPAFPKIDIGGATANIDLVQHRAAASLSRSRFEEKELVAVERRQRRPEFKSANAANVAARKASAKKASESVE